MLLVSLRKIGTASMGSYGSLFTVMMLDINKGVELFIYSLKTSLTCLNMRHSNTKDKIPVENKSGVYQIDCNDCDKIYILGKLREI